jgi:LmeA-like phospholipid-binding
MEGGCVKSVEPTAAPTRAKRAHVAGIHLLMRRRTKLLAFGLGPLLVAPLAVLFLPLPFLDRYLAGLVTERVSSQVACPGSLAKPPQVTLKGGRLLPQLLRKRMSELRLTAPDVTIGDIRHAAFDATLRDVSQPAPGTTRVGSMDASITVGFANMPTTPGEPPTTYGQAPDGSLIVKTLSPAENAKNVTAKLFLKMELRGESVATVPQRLRMFGRTLPADRIAAVAGGERTQKLPNLPDGVAYRSITPRNDGVHVELGGVATESLDKLPKEVDGRTVSYRARNGLLGISTALKVEPIINVPLTIHTAPHLRGRTLTLVPRSVEILGANRPPDDLLARLVLGQVKQESFRRQLPALPPGVRYRSVSVDNAGIKVAVGGVTRRPYSALSTGDDRPTTFGAENGLLTATTKGGNPDGSPTPTVLYAKPRITARKLDIAPQRIEMFGFVFPADRVLAQVRARDTSYPLQALPTNLEYRSVEVLPRGLRITMGGTGVVLQKGQLTGSKC